MLLEKKSLEETIAEITEMAKEFGLDFFPMRYEICPAEIIYTFSSYGMPVRFAHWSFGKSFHKMKLHYDLGLSRIYELVINSNPCYAFLLANNTPIQNKMIIAHVLAHADFFKNNIYFARTNRDMIEVMSIHARQIQEYERLLGKKRIECFLDCVLAIQEHIQFDPLGTAYGEDRLKKDLLLFLCKHSVVLEPWQKNILHIMREEMLYFWPQMETKIMNEGWASYWHTRMMRQLDLTEAEMIEFAKLNASVLQPGSTTLNPYLLGLKIFEAIEVKWGKEKIFEVRKLENDLSFLRNYLSKEVIEEADLYLYRSEGDDCQIVDKNWASIRDTLVATRLNGGHPWITVQGEKDGDLYLQHHYEDFELDIKYIEKTLPYIYVLWGYPVHIETVIEQKKVVFSYDGVECKRRYQ